MGKDKPAVIDALKFLVDNDFEVVKVVGPKGDKPVQGGIKLNKVAQNLGIDTVSDDDLYQILATDSSSLRDIDLVISFLFWKKIKKPLIDFPKIACINFHAAPLPEFRGVNGYSFGIYQNLDYWAVSAHMVDESFDTGEIIKVNKFKVNLKDETAFSLEQRSQIELLLLFKEVLNMIKIEKKIKTHSQSNGNYNSIEDFERLRQISDDDSLEDIDRKIRSFWYPPFGGTCIKLKGKEFTLINERLLEEIKELYWKSFLKKPEEF